MKQIVFLLVVLMVIFPLIAGCVSVTSHTISGYVYDCSYPYGVNAGIGGASVTYGNYTTLSDPTGFFNFTILSPPDPELEISAPGFRTYNEKPSRMVNGGFSLIPESVYRGLYLVVWNPEKSNPGNWLKKWEQQTRFIIVRNGASDRQIEDLVTILKTDRYRNLTGGRFSSAASPLIVDEKPASSELVGATVISFVPGTESGGIAHSDDRDGVISSAEITFDTGKEMNPTVVWHEMAHTVTAGGHIDEWPSVVSEVENDGRIRAPDERIFNCISNSPPQRGSSGSIPPPPQLPGGGPVTTNAGFVLINERKNQEALELFTQLLSNDPENINAWNGKGNALFNLGKNDDAMTAFDKAIAIDADYYHAYIGRGNVFLALGDNEEAMKAFDKALSIDPNATHAWNGKGNVLTRTGKNEEAIKAFDKAILSDPNNIHAYIGKGNALKNIRNFDDAMTAFDKVIGIDPNNSHAWVGKGNVLMSTGKNDEAITLFERVLSIDQNNTWAKSGKSVALQDIGNDLYTNGKNEEAISYFDSSIAMDPYNPWAWHGKGLALNSLGRYLEADDAFSRSLAIHEKNPDAWANKGLSLIHIGRCSEAKKAFEKSLSLDSNNQVAQVGLVNAGNSYYCHAQEGGSTAGNAT
jgi:tetratricopeptide (TPR) repeat protein